MGIIVKSLYIIPGIKLTFKLSYDTNYFTSKEIEQIGDRLILLLTNFLDRNQKLADISIISKSELDKLYNNGD